MCRGRPSMLTGAGPTRRPSQSRRSVVDRSPRCLTTPCWRRSAPISPVRPGTARGIAKVWARLRVMDGVRVARKRVLRLMREHALLSPHRARTRDDTPHDRQIITEAPNLMWGSDATQIMTVRDGKVWLFGVAEHWNAEALGWHVAKRGDRYAA